MISSLIAGTAVPTWDRSLMQTLKDATLGLQEAGPIAYLGVVNDQGEIYRRLVVQGPGERDALLGSFAERGFRVELRGDELVLLYSELAAELKTQD